MKEKGKVPSFSSEIIFIFSFIFLFSLVNF